MSEALARLAAAHGVATEYEDQSGQHRDVTARTLVAVLAALGVAADDDTAVAASLEAARLAPWRRVLPPVLVLRADRTGSCPVHVPHGTGVRLAVTLEDGTAGPEPEQVDHLVAPQQVEETLVGEAMFRLPAGLPTGWHELHAELTDGSRASCPLVVTPGRIAGPRRDGWGLALQLYATRSSRSWGVGDLADLADLARWSGFELGADFLLVNPLDAAQPLPPMEPSPYLPVSRRFANPLYLRIEDVPEYAYLPEPSRVRVAELAGPRLARDRSAELIDRDGAWAAKRAALELVHAVPRTPGREAAYAAYQAREGDGLDAFATWCALVEEHGPLAEWPAALRDPGSAEVAVERDRLAERVEFHRWLQWLVDDQLAYAQEAAAGAGMAIGVMHDLPVGVHPEGADAWALGEVLARGVTVGAPPDMYNQQGQDWSQPPWRPDALAAAGYAPYRDLLRTVLRHAGGIRVDHVLGLFRLWWIPQGHSPAEGTYVGYDHEALVGILALEAQRAGAVVVGEDLGTVERWVQDSLQERGILGTSILWFERGSDGRVPDPRTLRRDVLAAVTTHDLPPTPSYLAGEHVELRERLGLLSRPVSEEREAYARELAAWTDGLREHGLMPVGETGTDAMVLALHRFLARTPARLLALSLPDAVGDRRAQNQPGTDREYPNWQVPLTDGSGRAVLLDDLPGCEQLHRLVDALRTHGPTIRP